MYDIRYIRIYLYTTCTYILYTFDISSAHYTLYIIAVILNGGSGHCYRTSRKGHTSETHKREYMYNPYVFPALCDRDRAATRKPLIISAFTQRAQKIRKGR